MTLTWAGTGSPAQFALTPPRGRLSAVVSPILPRRRTDRKASKTDLNNQISIPTLQIPNIVKRSSG